VMSVGRVNHDAVERQCYEGHANESLAEHRRRRQRDRDVNRTGIEYRPAKRDGPEATQSATRSHAKWCASFRASIDLMIASAPMKKITESATSRSVH